MQHKTRQEKKSQNPSHWTVQWRKTGQNARSMVQNRTGMPQVQKRTGTSGRSECYLTGDNRNATGTKQDRNTARNRTGIPWTQNCRKWGMSEHWHKNKMGQECHGHKTGQECHGHKTARNKECQNAGIKIKWDKNANWRHKTGQESIAKGTQQNTGTKWDKNAKLKAQNRTGMPQERIAKGTQQDKSPTLRVGHWHRAWREVIK